MSRSHVQAELDATRIAMARLRLSAVRFLRMNVNTLATAKPPVGNERARTLQRAQSLIALDDAYTAATGVILTDKTAPDFPKAYVERCYAPSVYIFETFPHRVFAALERLRGGQPGVQATTAYAVEVYFSAIWPEGVVWPSDIDRPTPRKESAA